MVASKHFGHETFYTPDTESGWFSEEKISMLIPHVTEIQYNFGAV